MARKWKPNLVDAPAARLYVMASFDDPEAYFQVRKQLQSRFGAVDYETESITGSAQQSLYEFTPRRLARLVSFQRQVGREELVDIRRNTLAIEARVQFQGRPLVELDPGYVTQFSVVRSSLAEDFHRIYLYGGIYAEPLYYYERMVYRPYQHTPPFFLLREVLAAFHDIRLIHVSE
ncbi:MAG: DUF4416 family protein [Spirochaetales bacterium]|nr:DUF4416 family protein [Leptospiraceae bacterium]MCP5482903.1 DUF4416 family protein [Spirochaetales bacterium]MCP5486968.1 DUF4416 family protein [Spirochaetales bacterium]